MIWALFAERAWPKNAGQLEAPLPPGADTETRRAHGIARLDLADLRKALYPEDE